MTISTEKKWKWEVKTISNILALPGKVPHTQQTLFIRASPWPDRPTDHKRQSDHRQCQLDHSSGSGQPEVPRSARAQSTGPLWPQLKSSWKPVSEGREVGLKYHFLTPQGNINKISTLSGKGNMPKKLKSF